MGAVKLFKSRSVAPDVALAAFLKLAAPDGRLLDPTISLRFSGLQGGDSLTAVAQQPKIVATWNAFAL